jgi:hypothetical protein
VHQKEHLQRDGAVVPVERLGITQEHARKIQLFLLNQRLARSIYSQIVLTMKMIVEVNVFVMLRHFDRFGGLTGSVVEYVNFSNRGVERKVFNANYIQ